ncbi:sodium-dependent nutrient amino acid transporter 1-like, partial [Musca vetustissima]|uniref:sodium-dependent nutrient amino acid transporter 1-like n=1 Tax=Musca vetustissima TaxID=27455 RepID=UPI002AB6F63B
MSQHNTAYDNAAYTEDSENYVDQNIHKPTTEPDVEKSPPAPQRDKWGNDVEFLMSCIALSVGLGNVWRFPFIALENGGGAFLIPYIITLLLVGKPIYYLEMILGQFSSRGSVKVFEYAPIMRGIGYGQVITTFFISTYYSSLMAITLRYVVDSFYPTLPWSYCREEWGPLCIDSKLEKSADRQDFSEVKKTSAEFYFVHIVLREKPTIDDGIGVPNWILAITLAVAWLIISSVIIKGVKSSGKVSYFLAMFPYVVMLVLLIRSLTLPGAFDGVLFFLTPQWDKLLDAHVWYAAVTQVFFSLTVGYGVIPMYASFNRFHHNIKRDCTIVTTLDTFTSLLSGIVIFGILGHLAHESNTDDIKSVVKSGPGLAFISYPDAIAKLQAAPQVFSVLFFFMLFTLGVGTITGVFSTSINVICDRFLSAKRWIVVIVMAIICYCVGLMYITPGGQFMLNFIDFYGVTFIAIVLAIVELITAAWIY